MLRWNFVILDLVHAHVDSDKPPVERREARGSHLREARVPRVRRVRHEEGRGALVPAHLLRVRGVELVGHDRLDLLDERRPRLPLLAPVRDGGDCLPGPMFILSLFVFFSFWLIVGKL